MERFLRVGVCTSTHGLKGEMKVFPTTNDSRRFSRLKEVFLDNGKTRVSCHVEHVSYFKNLVIVKFREFGDINEILPFKGASILVSRENAVPLAENEYYIADLLDCTVVTDDGRTLGPVTDVLQTGANDVFVVQGETKEYLLPHIPPCVLKVDIEAGVITVHMMDGLEEL